jgi:hypothetical protein
MKEYNDDQRLDTFDIAQGQHFLNLQNKGASTIYHKSILIKQDKTDNYYQNKSYNFFTHDTTSTPFSSIKEGFTGGFGETDANKVNTKQVNKLQQHEKTFRQKLSEYSTAKKNLMEDTKHYLTNSNQVKTVAGKNIRLTDGSIGYVTNRGFFKHYPNMKTFTSAEGMKGCPRGFQNVNYSKANKSFGDMFGSEPGIYLGTPMKLNQPCVDTGVNVQVTSLQDPDLVPGNLEGCYRDSLTGKFTLQDDITNSTVDSCKLRAIDMGRSAYALKPDTNGKMKCWVANENITAKDVNKNLSTKSITSKKLVNGSSYGTNSVAGIMNNGQIVLGNINSQPSLYNSKNLTYFNEVPSISGCNPVYGSQINVKSASYGANCNGQIQIESIL